MGSLIDELKKKDKKGILNQNISQVGYPTKLLPLDFMNGYQVNVRDDNNTILDRWANVGIFSGSFVTIVGKPGVAKTAFCVQTAANICRPFNESEIILLDLEISSNITRLTNLMGYTNKELKRKFTYLNDFHYIEDIFKLVYHIAEIKLANKAKYEVKRDRKNEFNEDIVELAPTVIIIDSLAQVVTKDMEGNDEIAGMTYAGRKARAIKDFYSRARPIMVKANIIIFAINHLNAKIDINPMVKSQASIMYLKQDESTPGGNAPLYLAQTFWKFVQCGKFTKDKDGFNGFAVRAETIKSKTNQGGTSSVIIYTSDHGFDPYKTLLYFLKEHNLIEGRNPYSYFRSKPELKFDSREFSDLCANDTEFYKEACRCAGPYLYAMLGNSDDLSDYDESDEEVSKRLTRSYELENNIEQTEVSLD